MVTTTSEACTASGVSTFGCAPAMSIPISAIACDRHRVDPVGGLRACGAHVDPVAGQGRQETGCHLRPARVVDAHEQNGGAPAHGATSWGWRPNR